MIGEDWAPGRWWRVTYVDGAGVRRLWCETSLESEARESMATAPGGGTLERLYERHNTEWRPAQ